MENKKEFDKFIKQYDEYRKSMTERLNHFAFFRRDNNAFARFLDIYTLYLNFPEGIELKTVQEFVKLKFHGSEKKISKNYLEVSVTRMMSPYIEAGIVEELKNPKDKRAKIMKLTDKGIKIIEEMMK